MRLQQICETLAKLDFSKPGFYEEGEVEQDTYSIIIQRWILSTTVHASSLSSRPGPGDTDFIPGCTYPHRKELRGWRSLGVGRGIPLCYIASTAHCLKICHSNCHHRPHHLSPSCGHTPFHTHIFLSKKQVFRFQTCTKFDILVSSFQGVVGNVKFRYCLLKTTSTEAVGVLKPESNYTVYSILIS